MKVRIKKTSKGAWYKVGEVYDVYIVSDGTKLAHVDDDNELIDRYIYVEDYEEIKGIEIDMSKCDVLECKVCSKKVPCRCILEDGSEPDYDGCLYPFEERVPEWHKVEAKFINKED